MCPSQYDPHHMGNDITSIPHLTWTLLQARFLQLERTIQRLREHIPRDAAWHAAVHGVTKSQI